MFKIFCKRTKCDEQMISGARGNKTAEGRERSHRYSGLGLAGCRGNAKMDGRWGDKEVSDSHRRR